MGLTLGPPICFQFPRDNQQPVYGCLIASNSSHTLKYLGGFTMSYDEDTETSIAKPGAKKEHWTLLEVQSKTMPIHPVVGMTPLDHPYCITSSSWRTNSPPWVECLQKHP